MSEEKKAYQPHKIYAGKGTRTLLRGNTESSKPPSRGQRAYREWEKKYKAKLKIKKIQKQLEAKNLSEKKAARLGEKIRIIRLGIQKPQRGK